jgi:hypothetical protein
MRGRMAVFVLLAILMFYVAWHGKVDGKWRVALVIVGVVLIAMAVFTFISGD